MVDLTEDEKRQDVAKKITSGIVEMVLDDAEGTATAICSMPDFVDAMGDRERGCRTLANFDYRAVSGQISKALSKGGLDELEAEVEEVCLEELYETYRGVWLSLPEERKPWPLMAQDAIEREAKILRKALEKSLYEKLCECDPRERARRERERRDATVRRIRRDAAAARKQSRGWFSQLKEFFGL
jgi:hypothetical protein